MKPAALFAICPLAFVALPAQDSVPEPLRKDFTALAAAKSLHAHFVVLVGSDEQGRYSLWLSRDRKFKLASASGFVVSDGTNVYTYKKASNTYTKAPLTDRALAKFENRPEVVAWAPFFELEPQNHISAAQLGSTHLVGAVSVQDVAFELAPPRKGNVTLFLDPSTGVARGAKVVTDKAYLVQADELTVSPNPDNDPRYTFQPPDGATEVADADAAPTYAQVQELMTDNCMPCHDQTNRRAGFDLTNYDGVVATVTAGHPDDSLLIKALRGHGADIMPRGRPPLPEDKIHLIETWIQNGANKD